MLLSPSSLLNQVLEVPKPELGRRGQFSRPSGKCLQASAGAGAAGEAAVVGAAWPRSPLASEQEGRRRADYEESIRALAVEALGWPHLPPWKRLEWAAALRCRAVPVAELPPWYLGPRNLTRQDMGVDLLGLDDSVAVQCKCYNGTVGIKEISHFICMTQNSQVIITPFGRQAHPRDIANVQAHW